MDDFYFDQPRDLEAPYCQANPDAENVEAEPQKLLLGSMAGKRTITIWLFTS